MLAQGRLVDMQEIAVPWEKWRRVVCVVADMAVYPRKVFIGGPVRLYL
jgi:hypothetical protein